MIRKKFNSIEKLIKKIMEKDSQGKHSDDCEALLEELETLEPVIEHLEDFDPYEGMNDWCEELIPILEEME